MDCEVLSLAPQAIQDVLTNNSQSTLMTFCLQSAEERGEFLKGENRINPDILFSGEVLDVDLILQLYLENSLKKLSSGINELMWYRSVYGSVKSFFTAALRDYRDYTAWICVNDVLALLAKNFLLLHGVSLPDQISLISFDDTHEAFVEGITSYNFNMNGAASACFQHLLNCSEIMPYVSGKKSIVVNGMLVERSSTGLQAVDKEKTLNQS